MNRARRALKDARRSQKVVKQLGRCFELLGQALAQHDAYLVERLFQGRLQVHLKELVHSVASFQKKDYLVVLHQVAHDERRAGTVKKTRACTHHLEAEVLFMVVVVAAKRLGLDVLRNFNQLLASRHETKLQNFGFTLLSLSTS